MIDLQDKRIYTYGSFLVAFILLATTTYSFFQKPKYETIGNSNTEKQESQVDKTSTKTYPKPDISTTFSTLRKDNYSIKIFNLVGLPESVQSVVFADIEKKKMGFIGRYKGGENIVSLEGETPQIYQADKYVSIVMYFSEYNLGELAQRTLLCWTYDSEKEKIVSLSQILEAEETTLFEYLASAVRPSLVTTILEKMDNSGINTKEMLVKVSEDVAEKLKPEGKNFSNWYLKDGQIYFIFDIKTFLSDFSGNIDVPISISGAKLYFKNHTK